MRDHGLSNSPQGIEKSIFGMDIEHPVLPANVKTYYKWAEYFFTYTIVGQAISKLAQYPISNIYVTAPNQKLKEEVESILRKIKLKERLLAAGINYHIFGVSYMMPLFPVKKSLICPSCGYSYAMKDLERNNKQTYDYSNGQFQFTCQNPDCSSKGVKQIFRKEEQVVNDIAQLNLSLWSPYNIDVNHNDITGDRQWIYTIPPATAQKIIDNDHFILSTTPEMYLEAVRREAKIKINKDKLFVFEAPTLKKNGLPVPPMVRAFQSLYLHNKFQSANRQIAQDSLTPMRVMFPVDKGQLGRPQQKVIRMQDWKGKVRSEIDKWKADKNYIPIVPVQIGTANYFGDGKLLVVDTQMKAIVQDILAQIGVPIEFIYGGATWSRQNVSSMILENTFKTLSELFQELLNFIAAHINRSKGSNEQVSIRLRVPRLVEAMAENSYIQQANAAGKISDQTYLERFNISAHEERKRVKEDIPITEESTVASSKIQAIGQVEAQRIIADFQKEQRSIQRVESIKDQLAMSGIKTDDMARNIQAQKEMMGHQMQAQKEMMAIQEGAQERQMDIQMDAQLKIMKAQLEIQNQAITGQMVAEVIGQAEAGKVQMEIQEEMSAEERRKTLTQFKETLPAEMQENLDKLDGKTRNEQLEQMYLVQQTQNFAETLPPEIQAQIQELPEEQQMPRLQEMMQAQEQEAQQQQQMQEENPEAVKAQQKAEVDQQKKLDEVEINKNEEMESVVALAKQYNRLKGGDKAKFKEELMVEDTTKFSKVKDIADQMVIEQYTSELLNVEAGKEQAIWGRLQIEHSDLVDDVYKAIQRQQLMQIQAKEYAARLIELQGQEQQQQLIKEINESAPEEFKALIFTFYEDFLKAQVDAQQIRKDLEKLDIQQQGTIEGAAEDIAMNLMAMDDEARKGALSEYKYEDPELYKIIIQKMSEVE
jgi:hypothetical protein